MYIVRITKQYDDGVIKHTRYEIYENDLEKVKVLAEKIMKLVKGYNYVIEEVKEVYYK